MDDFGLNFSKIFKKIRLIQKKFEIDYEKDATDRYL